MDRQAEVFQGYKEHFSATSRSTQTVIGDLLRESYPEYRVTATYPHKCDLLGYAAAGHATATLERGDGPEEINDTLRYYVEPGPRMTKKPGHLKDKVLFARYRYEWNEHKFLVYKLEFSDSRYGKVEIFYMLSPRSLSIQGGPCPVTDKLLMAVGAWSTVTHKEIYVFRSGFWDKSAELYNSVLGCSWDDVILDIEMKEHLMEDVHGFFDNQELYKKFAVPWKRGLIFHGVPGNGKTISIKAVINTLENREEPIPSLYVKSFDSCQGEKEAISEIFRHARIMAPCLLIFEDIDSLVTDKTRSYFLNEVDGLENNDGILMIGSTNHLDALDPAISKRPSRFDRKYHFKLPAEEERIAYCRFWKSKLADNDMVEFPDEMCPVIAKLTEGFSFAYLKELFIWALLTVARGGKVDETDVKTPAQIEDTSSTNSTDGHVFVDREDAISQGGDEKPHLAETEGKAEAKPGVMKRIIPQIEVPASLQDNLFLKVLRAQIEMLHEEMDNSEGTSNKKPKVPDGYGNRSRAFQLGGPVGFHMASRII